MSARKPRLNERTLLHQLRKAEMAQKPPSHRPAMRKCLNCRHDFLSQWVGNRLCIPCGGVEVSRWEAAVS